MANKYEVTVKDKKGGRTSIYVSANDAEQLDRCMPPYLAIYCIDIDQNEEPDELIASDVELRQHLESHFEGDVPFDPEIFEKLEAGEHVKIGDKWLVLGPTRGKLARKLAIRIAAFFAIAYVVNYFAPVIGWPKPYVLPVSIIAAAILTWAFF